MDSTSIEVRPTECNSAFLGSKMNVVIDSEYEKHLSEPWFSLVSLKLKTVEGRINDGFFKEIKIGDTICWENSDFKQRHTSTIITKKIPYKTFADYLNAEGLEKCLPGMPSLEHGLSVYYKYFKKENEEKYGVVALHLKYVQNKHYLPIENPIDCPTYTYIKTGIKKVEGRKYSEKYHNYKKNDILIFTFEGERLLTEIKDIRLYKTLEDYIITEGYSNVLPGIKSAEYAVDIYNSWSKEEERELLKQKYGYGFMAIEIELI